MGHDVKVRAFQTFVNSIEISTGDVFTRYVVSSRKAYFETTARYIKFDGVTRVCIDGDTVGKVKYLEDGEVT